MIHETKADVPRKHCEHMELLRNKPHNQKKKKKNKINNEKVFLHYNKDYILNKIIQ